MKRGFGKLLLIAAFLIIFASPSAAAASGEVLVIDFYENYNAPAAADEAPEVQAGRVEQALSDINAKVNNFAWGPVMLILLVGTGVWFSLRTGFFQFFYFGHIWKNTIGKIFVKKKKDTEKGSVTPFQALTTALAATVGTGNIAGVAGAITLGGPGAVFWMWISALFGMMTKFAEVVLAVKYRERNAKGEWVGGPMYYIKNGLGDKWKWLGVVFSVFGTLAAFGIGNATQVGTMASTVINAAENLSPGGIAGTAAETTIRWAVGIVIAVVTALVIVGGIKRIGSVTEKLVPFMSLFYVVGSLIVIFANIGSIGPVFGSIFSAAFAPRAVVGGVSGFVLMNTVKRGVARGVFSNEAGLGSAPIAHASTSETNPVKQGLYGVIEVFLDTIVICTLTALVILMSGIVIPWGDSSVGGAVLTANGFATIFGNGFASIFITVAIVCFATTTILSWALYGQRCFGFLTGGRGVGIFQAVFILVIVVGATADLALIWEIADTLNGLMAIPNLIALLGLSGVVVKLTKEYMQQKKDGLIE